MACQFTDKCNSRLKDEICYSNNLIPMCSIRLFFKKEQKLRQDSIKRLLKRADKLNW